MIVVVKGLMGSGKTYISSILQDKFNFLLINADQLVSELYQTNKEVIQEINRTFDLSDKQINKKDLIELIAADSQNLLRLEEIVNPYIQKQIQNIINQARNENSASRIVIECQNIDDLNLEYDYELLAFATKDVLMQRIKERDNRTDEQINNFLHKQEQDLMKIQKHKQYTINTELSTAKMIQNIQEIMEVINADYDWKNS